jgi:hypothetical protein
MMPYIFMIIGLVVMTTIFTVQGTTANTTLADYEMAVGLCVNNDGVDHMEIDALVNKSDYMKLVVCDNGAEFKLNRYEEK